MAVIINGRDLTIEEVIRVCRHNEKVEIAEDAKEASRYFLDLIFYPQEGREGLESYRDHLVCVVGYSRCGITLR